MRDEIPSCDLCGAMAVPTYVEQAWRPGSLTRRPKVLSGYRCTRSGCDNERGMPMGWPELPSRP